MKQIKEMAHITDTNSKRFFDNVNKWVSEWQKQGYEVEVTYDATTPYGGATEYQVFIMKWETTLSSTFRLTSKWTTRRFIR